jgi:hypothetical protein
MNAKSESIAKKKDALEQLSTTFLLAWYLTMLNKSLQPLACSRPQGLSGAAILDADPTIRCWEMGGSHMFIAIAGMLTFVAFGIVLPYTTRKAIIRAASSNFVRSWEPFEYALMAQKLVNAVSLAIPQKWWLVQWLLCFAGIMLVLTAQTIATHRHGNGELLPYQHAYDNRISMLTLVAELLVLGLGLVSRSLSGSAAAAVVEVLFFAVVFGTLLYCAVLAWREVVDGAAASGLKEMVAEQLGVSDGLAIVEEAAQLRCASRQQGHIMDGDEKVDIFTTPTMLIKKMARGSELKKGQEGQEGAEADARKVEAGKGKLKHGTEGSANDNKGEEAMEEGSKGPTQNTANEEQIISITTTIPNREVLATKRRASGSDRAREEQEECQWQTYNNPMNEEVTPTMPIREVLASKRRARGSEPREEQEGWDGGGGEEEQEQKEEQEEEEQEQEGEQGEEAKLAPRRRLSEVEDMVTTGDKDLQLHGTKYWV